MLLLMFTLAIAVAGLAAIEFAQPAHPREFSVWSDDVERRMLRSNDSGRLDRW